MDIGIALRAARERRGLSLTQISSTTKIPLAHLEAIEANAFDHLPPGIFARGFLRAYAREVGLDPQEIVSDFMAERSLHAPPVVEAAASNTEPLDEIADARSLAAEFAAGQGSAWSSLVVVAALIVAVIAIHRVNSPDTTTPRPDVSAATSADDSALAVDLADPVATSGLDTSTVTMTAQAVPTGRFLIYADGPCWVEAVVDGRKLVYRLMQPGEQASIDPEYELVLRVGDPAALTYFVDGTPGEPLGQRGVPVTVRFTSEGDRITRAS